MEATVNSNGNLEIKMDLDGEVSGTVETEGTVRGELSLTGTVLGTISPTRSVVATVDPGHIVTGQATLTRSSVYSAIKPLAFDVNHGYVDNGVWKHEVPTRTYVDVYEALAGHRYFITLGVNVGTRFRAMFSEENPDEASANIQGERIINKNNPSHYDSAVYVAPTDGYISIGKDNIGKTGVKTYVYDSTLAWL